MLMPNRTTKPAPHLDSVHVVFGLVISGFEVIEQIENLKTDSASRPYADVRVIDCGVLVTKSAKDVLEKKRKAWSHSEASNSSSSSTSTSSESSSDSEYENERTRRRKRKRRNKAKQSRKRRREERKKEETKNKHSHSDRSETNEKSADLSVKRDKPVVRPEEIPPVPENRFLLRRDAPIINTEPDLRPIDAGPASGDQKPSVSKSGRKIRGRGTIRYHTPPHSRSCTESDNNGSSETPPHWKEEMQRLRTYRAPSGEKWSKGDKLSDPGRWDERSLSPRSRSWSHNGFSDLSTTQHVSHRKKHRKEKKVKHKKKAKKQKHLKKHKQMKKKQTPSTELESSPSSTRRKKSLRDQERASRSSSLTSKDDSSRRAWSKSDRDKRSSASLSTRDSRSYYKSRSRTRSRSRSYSRSSQSRNTRMSSQSRSRSRSSSASKPVKTVSNSPKNVVAHLKECKLVSVEPVRTVLPQNDKLIIQPVVVESLPVIPLSDSPPPSRWKPGQKPWKPSYERLQEMKAKTTQPPAQTSYSLISIKDPGSSSSYPKQQKSSESDRSRYSKIQSNRSSGSWWKYSSRTSRSRSSSKSSSRSRSRSSSRSQSTVRSRSGNPFPSDQSCYSGSSSYFSLSEDDRQKSRTKLGSRERNSELSKKRQSSSESTLPYVKGMSSLKPRGASRSVESSVNSEKLTPSQPAQEKEQLRSEKVGRKQNKRSSGCNQREEKPRPGQDSNCSKQKVLKEKSETLRSGRKAKTKKCASDESDSGSNSEKDGTQDEKENSRLLSAKEEGEASSDSDTDPCPPTQHKLKSEPVPDTSKGNKHPSSSDTETSDSDAGSRDKSRKPKRSSKKSFRKVHGKKAKEKSKNKKEKKHKAEKRKETFHWQPPLEFGEEEEEEEVIARKPGMKEEREKHAKKEAKDKNKDQDSKSDKTLKDQAKDDRTSHEEPALSKRGANQASSASQLNKRSEEKAISSTPVPNSNKNLSVSKNPTAAQENNKTGPDAVQIDDMEICTPDHNSPVKVNLELSPVSLKLNFQDIKASTSSQVPISTATRNVRQAVDAKGLTSLQEGSQERDGEKPKASTSVETVVKMEVSENISNSLGDNKWKPLQGAGNLQLTVSASNIVEMKNLAASSSESKPPGLRIEIKSKNKIRPGSLFDEVRKTARLNQRPRNHETSSEEDSATQEDSQSRSRSRSRSKSDVKSRHRTRSLSYSHSRSQSRSSTYSYRSRSYSRSRSRGWYSRGRSRTRSSSYNSCRSDTHTYSRSRSRSNSYTHRSRSRSYTYDSYYSRSRSRSRRSDSYHRSRSYDRRSRSYGSDSESDRSYSNCRSPSESSRYS